MVRSPAQWFHPIIFFVIFISLFGIGLAISPDQLMKISPAVIWIAFLFTSLLTIETLFKNDQEDGSLEQLLLSPTPLWWLLLAKSLALWIVCCLPLITIMPLLAMSLGLALQPILLFALTLFVGSPALTFMGVLGAALTITMPRSGLFLGLLLLPLYIPILILGESAVVALLSDGPWPVFQIALLAGLSVLAITLIPHACAAALRGSME